MGQAAAETIYIKYENQQTYASDAAVDIKTDDSTVAADQSTQPENIKPLSKEDQDSLAAIAESITTGSSANFKNGYSLNVDSISGDNFLKPSRLGETEEVEGCGLFD